MHGRKSLAGSCISGAFSCLLLAGSATADWFATRNQNPLTLFQGQPLPLDAGVPAANDWRIQQSLDIANTLNPQSAGNQALYVDFESYTLNTRFSKLLAPHWSISIDMPLIYRGGGIFDNAIDSWHRAFGLPRAQRPFVANDRFAIQYAQNGTRLIDLQDSSAGVADIGLGLGYHFRNPGGTQFAFWFNVELPSGDQARLTGNDQTDFSITLATHSMPNENWVLDANLGVVRPGGDLIDANPTAGTIVYTYLGSRWQVLDWLQLQLQLEAHQAYFRDSTLDLMDSAVVLTFGGSIVFDACQRLQIGMSEDIDVGTSPDITLLLSWQLTTC